VRTDCCTGSDTVVVLVSCALAVIATKAPKAIIIFFIHLLFFG
jgi:hypothetical protein